MNRLLFVVPFCISLAACGLGGGGADVGGPIDAPPGPVAPPDATPTSPSPQSSGVVSACAGDGMARIDCRLPGAGFDAALFQGASVAATYGGTPVRAPLSAATITVTGLANGSDTFFGLAIRAAGTTTWTPVGTIVRTRPGAPIYVDAAANPAVANGQSPATAFASLFDALLVAGAANGGNVWVHSGDYANGPFPLGPNVHLAGGFGDGFDLAARDTEATPTRLLGSSTQEIVSVLSGGSDGSVDGFVVDGGNTVLKGVDVVDSDVELRNLTVRNCADRGIKAVTSVPTPNRRLVVLACNVAQNVSDGLSAAGAIDVVLDLSNFDANGQEGADIDNLEAPDGGTVSLRATGCRFYGNSFEGLDVDLAAVPLAVGTGEFHVLVENCRFEVNGMDGLLIDQEHEFFPGFSADIRVRGCVMRANRLAGLHIDADARGSYTLERLRCTANAGDGVLVTSETAAGELVLTASWLAGNLGAGARVASGNKVLLASHCAFAGNQNGGLRSDAQRCAVANSIFLRQASARANAVAAGNVDADGSVVVFANAPVAFSTVTAAAQGTLTVDPNPAFTIGTSVVAGDDAERLLIVQGGGMTLELDSPPTAFATPGMLTAYAGDNVRDDLRLTVTSPAVAKGLTTAGVTAPDAGPFGTTAAAAPGLQDPLASPSLRLLSITPAAATGVGQLDAIVLAFDRPLDPSSVTADRVLVLRDGSPAQANLTVATSTITLAPAAPGWSGQLSLRLHAGLAGADGSLLDAPLLAPIRLL